MFLTDSIFQARYLVRLLLQCNVFLNLKKMKGKHFLIAIIPVLFGLNSCKTQSAAEASKDPGETITQTKTAADFDSQITGKYWRVTELNGNKITADASNTKEPHIILKTDG